MILKKKITGWSMTIIGFILSPLSWWNDIIINVPLAYVFALPFGWIDTKLFVPAMIIGYWLTNISGFVLMHQGLRHIITERKQKNFKKELIKISIVSLVYTLIIIICIQMGWLRFLPEYLR